MRRPGCDERLPGNARDCRARRAGQRSAGRAAYRRADLLHRCDLRLPPSTTPEVLTVHDTAWLHFDDEAVPLPHHQEAARNAKLVLVPSCFSAGEVISGLGIAD